MIGFSLRRLAGTLLSVAVVLVVVWSTVHVVARAVRGEGRGGQAVLTMLMWGHPAADAANRAVVAEFEATHPGVRVRLTHVPYANYQAKLKTMIAAGDPPDVFFLPYGLVPEYASLGMARPLDAALAAGGGGWADDIYPVILRGFRFDVAAQARGEGPLWGIPGDFSPLAMYLNVDLFERAGVPVPTGGWSWEAFDRAVRAIDALGPEVYGAYLGLWADPLLAIVWNHGGELFHRDAQGRPDFTRPAIDDAGLRRAFERIRRLRIDEQVVHNAIGINRSGKEEFLTGRVGVIGPTGRWTTTACEAIDSFRFAVVPIPHRPGVTPRSPIMTAAWTVSAKSRHPEQASALAVYLASPTAQRLRSRIGSSVPSIRAVAEQERQTHADRKTADAPVYLEIAQSAALQHWPRRAEFEDILMSEQDAALRLGSRPIDAALANVQRRWAAERSSPLRTGSYPRMPWWPVVGTLLGVLAVAAVWLTRRARRERLGPLDRAHERAGLAFIGPWVVGFVVLTAGPMFLSGVLALTRWSAITPLGEAEYVGAGNFVHMLLHDPPFWKSLRITAYFVVLAIPIGQVAALAVALLMNVEVRGIAVFRTVYFVPSVITGVVLGTLWLALFNNDYGLINRLLGVPLGWVGGRPPDWFGADAAWAAVPAFVLMGLWGVGSAMVIYLAGLKAVPRSLLEAATIDGASAWRRLWHVTLPMLSPLVFFNLVMGIIGSFQVFTQAFVMTGRGPDDATLFYVLYLYLQAFEFHNMGYASAMAWVLFVLTLAVTLVAFRGSRGLVHYEGLKA